MKQLVYNGPEIKVRGGGHVFKRGRPRMVNVSALSDSARKQIQALGLEEFVPGKEIKRDVEIVHDTPGYKPPAGHPMPSLTKPQPIGEEVETPEAIKKARSNKASARR